jgi:hypothetical protein
MVNLHTAIELERDSEVEISLTSSAFAACTAAANAGKLAEGTNNAHAWRRGRETSKMREEKRSGRWSKGDSSEEDGDSTAHRFHPSPAKETDEKERKEDLAKGLAAALPLSLFCSGGLTFLEFLCHWSHLVLIPLSSSSLHSTGVPWVLCAFVPLS